MKRRLLVIAIAAVLTLFMAWKGAPRTTAKRIKKSNVDNEIARGDIEVRKKEIAQRFGSQQFGMRCQGANPDAVGDLDSLQFVDTADIDQQRDQFIEQYQDAADIDRIDPTRTEQENQIKTIDEHFETSWADDCPSDL